MRAALLLLCVVAFAQERAELTRPVTVDATIRRYEIVGVMVSVVPTLARAPDAPTVSAPVPTSWNLTIRYVDNHGTQYIDVHADETTAPRLIRELVVAPSTESLHARLLKHLIAEGKIGPSRLVTGGGGK